MDERLDNVRVLVACLDGLGEEAAQLLAQRGAAVTTARSGDAALSLARGRRFDVLVSDASIVVPDGSGAAVPFVEAVRGLAPDDGGATPAIRLANLDAADAPRAGRDERPGEGRYQDVVSLPLDGERLARSVRRLAQSTPNDPNAASSPPTTASLPASGATKPSLPSNPSDEGRAASATPLAPPVLRILVVDDTPVVADVLGQIVGVLGHQARVVHSGREAIEAIAADAGAFDIVFSDISMPDMNGHELAERLVTLRREGQLGARLIIAMSGYSDPEERARSLQSGFDRHIVKPPDIGDLETLFAEVQGMAR